MSVFERLWRIPLRFALLIALPLQVIVLWTAVQGYAAAARFHAFCERSPGPEPIALNLEQWRYFARDLFRKDLNRLTLRHFPESDDLETVSLTVAGRDLASLNADLPASGKERYYKAQLELGEDKQQVKVRYVGDNEWHWLFPQKSWRVKTRSGDPIRDRRSFSLKNSPFKLAVSETLTSQLSDELGVLTPDVEPIKLMLNGTYGGLYLFWDVVDESLIRRARRMPGSIYSGDTSGVDSDGVCDLFKTEHYWEKSAARNAERADDRSDIRAFIDAVNGSALEFHAFAERHIDFDAFAGFVAVDRALGGKHHDYCHNHKLYFDPYKGRWEPVQWDFGVWFLWGSSPTYDCNEYPSLTRLKQHPEYAHRLAKKLYDLLQWLTPQELESRLDALCDRTRVALAADGMRDFRHGTAQGKLRLKKAPSITYSMAEFDDDVALRKRGFRERTARHRDRFADCRISYRFEPGAGEPGAVAVLEVAADGTAAATLQALEFSAAAEVEIYRDSNLSGELDADDELIGRGAPTGRGTARASLQEAVYPGLRKQARPTDYQGLYGLFELVPAPLHYRYFVRSERAVPALVALEAKNSLTEAVVGPVAVEALAPAPDVYSLHPWQLPRRGRPVTTVLGPGVVPVTQTRRYAPEETVVIAPGTTLQLGANVSMHFFGKVMAQGTPEQPIRFEPLDAGPWGVVSLHGKGTRGSRFSNCHWGGGSVAQRDLMIRTGMMSVIDTADIVIEDSSIGVNHVGDDAMHWGYVIGGVVRNCRFEGARSDAFDLDLCEDVRIEACEFVASGNDSLDLMTSKIEVDGCRFLRAGDKGISVGEATTLDLAGSSFLGCVIGIEVKDDSIARLGEANRFRECGTAVNIYRKNVRYTNGGTLVAGVLDISGSTVADVEWDKRSTVPDELKRRDPRGGRQ